MLVDGVEPSLSLGTDIVDIVDTKTADTLDAMMLYLPAHHCVFDPISLPESFPGQSLSMLAFFVVFMFWLMCASLIILPLLTFI